MKRTLPPEDVVIPQPVIGQSIPVYWGSAFMPPGFKDIASTHTDGETCNEIQTDGSSGLPHM